jgi:hypothetical protein
MYGVTVSFDVSDVVPKQSSKDVLAFHKHAWLRNCCVWCSLVLVWLIIVTKQCVCVGLAVGDSHNSLEEGISIFRMIMRCVMLNIVNIQ